MPSGFKNSNRIPMRHARRFHAMTLVELLIVLAVVSILAAVALPVLSRTRLQAHRAVCVTNMKQAATALSLYLQDHDERYPDYRADEYSAARSDDQAYIHDRFCQATFLQPGQLSWVHAALGYSSSSVQRVPNTAPGMTPRRQFTFFCPLDNNRETRLFTSYEYKMWLAEGRHLADIEFVGNVAMLWEPSAYHTDQTHDEYDRRTEINLAFVDGHVKWIRLSEINSAQHGEGPNLHWLFPGVGSSKLDAGKDVSR